MEETQTFEEAEPNAVGEVVPFRVRSYRGESAFVAHSWLRSYQSAPAVRNVPVDDYYKFHARLVSKLIDRGQVYIAVHAEHPELFLGHVCGERDERGCVVHYTYVKSAYRRTGIATALWRALFDSLCIRGASLGQVRYTHAKAPFTEVAARKGWTYSMYPAFRQGWES